LQEKIENTEEMATGVRAKVDILAEELESLGDTEEVRTDLDAALIILRREYKKAGQELAKQKVILKSDEDKFIEFKKKRVERQARAKRALQLKGELNSQRQILEILDAGLAEMRRELAGLPEEDLALLEELARAEIAIYEAEKEVASGIEGGAHFQSEPARGTNFNRKWSFP
jgi:chromosome segregation ATPase